MVAVADECSVPQGAAVGNRMHDTSGDLTPGARSSDILDWLQPFHEGLSGDAPNSENVEVKQDTKKEDIIHPPPVFTEESRKSRSSKPTGEHNVFSGETRERDHEMSHEEGQLHFSHTSYLRQEPRFERDHSPNTPASRLPCGSTGAKSSLSK